jgi:hypothetical protein
MFSAFILCYKKEILAKYHGIIQEKHADAKFCANPSKVRSAVCFYYKESTSTFRQIYLHIFLGGSLYVTQQNIWRDITR